MKKLSIILALLLFLGLGFRMIFMEKSNKIKNEPLKKKVTVAKISQKEIMTSREYMAEIRGESEVDLASKVNGRVIKINKQVGDFVLEGEVLAVIDGDELWSQAKSAKNSLDDAKETLDETEDYYDEVVDEAEEALDNAKDYYKDLKDSKEDESKIKEAKRNVKQAEKALDSAKQMRELQIELAQGSLTYAEGQSELAESYANDTNLRAPFSGVVTRKYLEIGSLAGPNTAIFALAQSENKIANFTIDAETAKQLNIKDTVFLKKEGRECLANINEKRPSLNSMTQKIKVEAKLQTNDCGFLIGELANVKIKLSGGHRGLVAPIEAVVKQYHDNSVFVLKQENDKQWVELRMVKIGLTDGEEVEILEGLKEGDQVVVSGQFYLKDGDLVELTPLVSLNSRINRI
ncbi:MAG: efflux RND transporter periplasmic adaptor subunit [Candidatus Moranbacteria bacterium]|nr:efflux RND transporter periplasmic adaptor subunit [Candidatus Moranbacteria bacterium]